MTKGVHSLFCAIFLEEADAETSRFSIIVELGELEADSRSVDGDNSGNDGTFNPILDGETKSHSSEEHHSQCVG